MASIELRHVTIEFPIYNMSSRSLKKDFLRLATGGNVRRDSKQHIVVRSLNNINLKIQHGDRIGLIGHNGAGKSTMLRLLAKIYEPTHGQINIDGHVSPMLDLMQGMELESSGQDNILMRGIILGLTHKEIKKQIDDIAELTGLGDYLNMPVRTYSSGMMIRLAFAIASSIKPDILLIDEVFSAGDSAFIKRAQARMVSLLDQSSIVVMANHTDDLIREFCNKALLLESGTIKYIGSVDDTLALYHETNATTSV